VNFYFLFVYIEHNGDESPKENQEQPDTQNTMASSSFRANSMFLLLRHTKLTFFLHC